MLVQAAVLAVVALGLALVVRRGLSVDEATPLSVSAGLVTASCAFVLSVFGAVLKATTHHRGLGGVTFAVLGLTVALGAAAFFGVWGGGLGKRRASAWMDRGGAVLVATGGLFALVRAGGLDGTGALALALPLAAVGWVVGAAMRRERAPTAA